MFGFGNKRDRKKFNGTIDTKLNNEYQIQTKDNKLFPGMLAYLDYLDTAWKVNMSDDEAAMYMATLYYCGLIRQGRNELAVPVGARINEIASFCIPKGLVSNERWEKFNNAISEAKYEP